jgi:lipopolysaccharide transport system ATP-binding protein
MNDTLVKVEGVSKKFCRSLKKSLWYGMQDLGNELIGQRHSGDGELRPDEFWSVKDVSFELKRGECLGLIGPNGAGKSTLLKMLNGLIKPDEGRIEMNGRVSALIELGAGFNHILSGRENIYVNGSVLGFTKNEIDRKLDAIIDFAEIEEFIDSPVQNYSSGMKVRLGFAVAAQMEPDVLMIDEVLAVGDAAFRTKCLNRMDTLMKKSALIFVTHSMPMMSRISSSVLLMEKGRSRFQGVDVSKGMLAYFENMNIDRANSEQSNYLKMKDVRVTFENSTASPKREFTVQQKTFSLCSTFEVLLDCPDFVANLAFFDLENKPVAQCYSLPNEFKIDKDNNTFTLNLKLDSLPLNQGKYTLHLGLVEALPGNRKGHIFYSNRDFAEIIIETSIQGWAPVQLTGRWTFC